MSLDDLSDASLPSRPPLSTVSQDFVDHLTDLLDQSQYQWAAKTLEGIRETVTQTNRITEGQTRAVANITRGAEEGESRRERNKSSRRYEGWSR